MRNKFKGTVIRLVEEDKQTLGRFHLYEELEEVFSCAVLELPDKENKTSISSIPEGTYKAKKRYSQKFGNHYHILEVPGREWILIHFGNYYTDIRGCLLFGKSFTDINGDGHRDVTSSKATMKKLLGIAPDEFEIEII